MNESRVKGYDFSGEAGMTPDRLPAGAVVCYMHEAPDRAACSNDMYQ